MTDKNLEKLRQQIIDEINGSKFSNLVQKLLKKYSSTDRESVLNILMDYSTNGQIVHWRNFVLTDIIKLVNEEETKYEVV
jgi:hypothetical protein